MVGKMTTNGPNGEILSMTVFGGPTEEELLNMPMTADEKMVYAAAWVENCVCDGAVYGPGMSPIKRAYLAVMEYRTYKHNAINAASARHKEFRLLREFIGLT